MCHVEEYDAIDAQAEQATAAALRKKAAAVRAKEQAAKAEGKVLELDDAQRAAKRARKTG